MHYKPPSKGKMTESNIRDHKSVYQGFGKGENMTMESQVQAIVTYPNGMVMHDSARMDECVDSLGNAWTSRNGLGKKEGFGTWIDNAKGQSYVMQGNSGNRFEPVDAEDQPVMGQRIQRVEIKGTHSVRGGFMAHLDKHGNILAFVSPEGQVVKTESTDRLQGISTGQIQTPVMTLPVEISSELKEVFKKPIKALIEADGFCRWILHKFEQITMRHLDFAGQRSVCRERTWTQTNRRSCVHTRSARTQAQ